MSRKREGVGRVILRFDVAVGFLLGCLYIGLTTGAYMELNTPIGFHPHQAEPPASCVFNQPTPCLDTGY